jgi:hypothetical protein
MSTLQLTTVATYGSSFEAQVAKNCLQESGISACVVNDTIVDMAWHLGRAVGGVKVEVPQSEANEARDILEQLRTHGAQGEEADDPAEVEAPNPIDADLSRSVRAAAMGILFLPLQFYSMYLMAKVAMIGRPLGRRRIRKLWLAGALNSYLLMIIAMLLIFVLPIDDESESIHWNKSKGNAIERTIEIPILP